MNFLLINNAVAKWQALLATLPDARVHALAPRRALELADFLAREKMDVAIVSLTKNGLRPRTILRVVKNAAPACAVLLFAPRMTRAEKRKWLDAGFDEVAARDISPRDVSPRDVSPKRLYALVERARQHAAARNSRPLENVLDSLPTDARRYRALVETARDAIFILDARGAILFANHAAEQIFETPDLTTRALTIFDLLAFDASPYAEQFRAYLETGHTALRWNLIQLRGKTGQAQHIPFEPTINSYRQGAQQHFTLFLRDVSERQQIEDALRASQKYAENIVDSSLDMIIATDINRRIVEFNRAAEETFGYKRAEVFGQNVQMLYADAGSGKQVFQEVSRFGKTVQHILNRRKNGQTFPSLLAASTLKNVEGLVIGYMGVSRDITVEQELENQLRGRIALLEELAEMDRELAQPRPLRELLPILTQHAAHMLNADESELWLYEAAQRQLQLVVANNEWHAEGHIFPMGVGFVGQVAAARETQALENYSAWEYRLPNPGSAKLGAMVGAPLLNRGELLGVLLVARERQADAPNAAPFTTADSQAFGLLASQSASVIHNTRLWEELSHRAEQFGLLYDAGLALNSVLEPHRQLQFLCEIAMRALGADRVLFFRHEPTTATLHLEFGLGGATDALEDIRHIHLTTHNDDTLEGMATQLHTPLNVFDLYAEPRWTRADAALRSGLWVTVEHADELRGVLAVFSERIHAFSSQDERLLALFANQAAVALENARIYVHMERAKREWEQSVDTIDEGISLVDADGKILRVNRTLAAWLQTTPRELVGRHCCQVLDACATPPAHCPHAQLMAARDKIYRAELDAPHLGRMLNFTSYPLWDPEQGFVGAVNVLKDVSLEKHLQAQLIQSEKMAATGRLAASLAHEINNPLQGIQGCLELAYNFRGDTPKQERYLALAKDELNRLVATTQRMLDFYRPAKGTRSAVRLGALLEDVLALSAKRIQHSRVRVTLDLEAELPPVAAVENQIKQVFLNLVLNALEAMLGEGELHIQGRRENDGVAIRFQDTGVGIPAAQLDKIFEPFFTTKPNGTGLGLGVSHNIITHHGGTLTVVSAPQRGSTVTVWLPNTTPVGR